MNAFRILILIFSLQAATSASLSAQIITNGDGTPLTRRYCRNDQDYAIAGSPAGGTFSGCGVTQVNGQWYFNPLTASNGISVFPYSCPLTYTVNGNSLSIPLLVWKPVRVEPPLSDINTCDGNFYLEAEMLYAGDYDFSWTPAAALDAPASDQTNGSVNQTTTFVLTAVDVSSGCTGSDTVVVNRLSAPQLSICNDTTLLSRQQVRLWASGADRYEWSPAQWLDSATSASPLASPQAPITYTVKGFSASGCVSTASVRIDLLERMLIPNAFSPNGDGINDEFRIMNYGYQVLQEFRIFNRWGELVFATMDATKGWDGTQRGRQAEAGSYPYYIRFEFRDGSQKVYKGDVTLIR